MIDKDFLEKRRKEYAEELHAGSVYRDILAREKERLIYERRWFWELLQNAKDSVSLDDKVNVKVEMNDFKISFSHSGDPFKVDEILSLIIQGSSKIEDDNKVGRFGTGFMTTYLLSKKVKITGKLEKDGGFFEFDLNRDVEDIENVNSIKEFFQLQKKSNDEFINSIKETTYVTPNEFQTKFVYHLDPKGKVTAEKGFESLRELIPFTQLFNDQIGSVSIIENDKTVTFEKNQINTFKFNDYVVEEWQLKSSDSLVNFKSYIIRNENFDILCVTESYENIEYLKNIDHKYPKLFFTFPLIGTEEMGIPFIINSNKFDPKIERDGIYLNSEEGENENIIRNKELISKALCVAIEVFPKIIMEKKIQSVFNLFNFSLSKKYLWIDQDWFTELKNNLLKKLSQNKFISLEDDYLNYYDLSIPYSPNENNLDSIWSLVNLSNSFNEVSFDEHRNWIRIAKNVAQLKNVDIFTESNIIGSVILRKYVAQKIKISKLAEELIIDVYDWLDMLYKFLLNDLEEFNLNVKILPNQNEEFTEAEELSWDGVNDDIIISISNSINLNFSKKLISNNISKFKIAGVEHYNKETAIQDLTNKFNSFTTKDYNDNQTLISSNAYFLRWLIENSELDIIKDLKIISIDKNDDANLSSRIFPDGKHLLLPPKQFFEDKFPKYSELIREKDCLHPYYLNKLNASDFEYLSKNNIIHYSPLVKRKEKLDSKSIDLLIRNNSDLAYLKDDDGKLIQEIEIEYSDFAYLTTSVGHIYDRNSTTSSSIRIFDFLLNEATLTDDFFNENDKIISVSQNNIVFDKTIWLKRAKINQWVNVKDLELEGSNKFVSESPSSKNLSELIKDNDELIKTIRGEKQIKFLSSIGVGVSDLIRNTLKTDEIRISWDKALTTMITSGVNPELAQAIFSDPSIQKEYQKRLNNKNLINRNQKLGALVEELFEALILKLRRQGVNIDINREPFGSDYVLTEESSDFVNDKNEEEVLKINEWLIELKATGKDFAAMTQLQATTANEKKDNFALVVVPLTDSDINIDYIRINARIIDNIGYKIKEVMTEFDTIETKKSNLFSGKNGISLNIEESNVRFRIDSSIWNCNDAMSIPEFISKYFDSRKNK